jgi:hypothetical protein
MVCEMVRSLDSAVSTVVLYASHIARLTGASPTMRTTSAAKKMISLRRVKADLRPGSLVFRQGSGRHPSCPDHCECPARAGNLASMNITMSLNRSCRSSFDILRSAKPCNAPRQAVRPVFTSIISITSVPFS